VNAPRFRKATIALGFDTGPESGLLVTPHGVLTANNLPLRRLIGFAYDLQDPEISGPESLDSERYTITAEAETASARGDITPFRLMVQGLLAERFALKFHRETQRLNAFALDRVSDALVAKRAAALEPGPILRLHGARSISVGNASMAPLFTSWLSTRLGTRVINRTGLLGNYSFELRWEGEANAETLKAALHAQLGLALEPIETDVERLVVDGVSQPSGLQPRPVEVRIDVSVLDRYVGRYQFPDASIMTVSREGSKLFAEMNRQSIEIFAASETEFFPKIMPARIEFRVDGRGRATALILRQAGHEVRAARSEETASDAGRAPDRPP